jgi:ADP-ribose pyrophosphatase YjhB (NUDIX family)
MGHVERRIVQRHNRMICFDDGVDRFQMRAAGIAREDGHLLIHRATLEDYWTLPGGRMEQGETSAEALLREMREELLVDAEIGALAVLAESFFENINQHFHEIGFYHAVQLPPAFPRTRDGVCHSIVDGVPLEFRWIRADRGSLAEWRVFPQNLWPFLLDLPSAPVHIIDRTRR